MSPKLAARRLDPAARAALLDGLVERAASPDAGHRQVLVFDLDGTLLDNRTRHLKIIAELAEHWQQAQPEVAERLRAATIDHIAFQVTDSLRALGVHDPQLHDDAEQFWFDRFFTDAYLRHDVALEGAVRFTQRCYQAGANLVYLTGRDVGNMSLGTFASLRDLGFPISQVGTELVTKPDFDTPDRVFKERIASQLERLGTVLAVFDNEPANCNTLLAACPGCTAALVHSNHAPNPPELHPAVQVIDSFET